MYVFIFIIFLSLVNKKFLINVNFSQFLVTQLCHYKFKNHLYFSSNKLTKKKKKGDVLPQNFVFKKSFITNYFKLFI